MNRSIIKTQKWSGQSRTSRTGSYAYGYSYCYFDFSDLAFYQTKPGHPFPTEQNVVIHFTFSPPIVHCILPSHKNYMHHSLLKTTCISINTSSMSYPHFLLSDHCILVPLYFLHFICQVLLLITVYLQQYFFMYRFLTINSSILCSEYDLCKQ